MISNRHQVPKSLLNSSSAYEQHLLLRYSQQSYVTNDDILYLYQVRIYRGSKDHEFLDLVKRLCAMDMVHQELLTAHYYKERPKLGLYPRLDMLTNFVFKDGQMDINIIYPGLAEWWANTDSEYDLDEVDALPDKAWAMLKQRLDDAAWENHVLHGHHSPGHNNDPSFVKKVFRWAKEDSGDVTFNPKDDE